MKRSDRSNNRLTRPLWLIANSGDGETLRIGDDEALPVFSFREEAEMFLTFSGLGDDWHIHESAPAELVPMLYGPWADVKDVALDPLPEMVAERTIGLVSLRRNRFVKRFVAGRRLLQMGEPVQGTPSQQDPSREDTTPENGGLARLPGTRRPLSRCGFREVRPRKTS